MFAESIFSYVISRLMLVFHVSGREDRLVLNLERSGNPNSGLKKNGDNIRVRELHIRGRKTENNSIDHIAYSTRYLN